MAYAQLPVRFVSGSMDIVHHAICKKCSLRTTINAQLPQEFCRAPFAPSDATLPPYSSRLYAFGAHHTAQRFAPIALAPEAHHPDRLTPTGTLRGACGLQGRCSKHLRIASCEP